MQKAACSRQKAESRKQKAESGRQKAESRKQKAKRRKQVFGLSVLAQLKSTVQKGRPKVQKSKSPV
jgi:hypothetical protein